MYLEQKNRYLKESFILHSLTTAVLIVLQGIECICCGNSRLCDNISGILVFQWTSFCTTVAAYNVDLSDSKHCFWETYNRNCKFSVYLFRNSVDVFLFSTNINARKSFIFKNHLYCKHLMKNKPKLQITSLIF